MNKRLIYILSLFFIVQSCSITRTVPNGEYLLTKNDIEIDNNDISQSDLRSYIRQKPNKKILYAYRFHLRMYNFGSFFKDKTEKKRKKSEKRVERKIAKGKEVDLQKENKRINRTMKNWLQQTVGDKPVILDSLLTESTAKQLKMHLFSIGYFNAEVDGKIDYYAKKKAEVTYAIQTGEPYTINNISYTIKDPMVKAFVYASKSESLLKEGDIFNVDLIEKERLRISRELKNRAYYHFSKEYILFNIDTTKAPYQADINITIRQAQKQTAPQDSLSFQNHKRYKVNKIYIYPEYQAIVSDTSSHDTTKVIISDPLKQRPDNVYYFLHREEKLKINPKTITQSVYITSKHHFKLEDVEQTQKGLAELGIYKYINIKFEEIKDSAYYLESRIGNLNCYVYLSRTKVQAVTGETEGTNTGGDLGIAGSLIYSNKNLFRGAEIFSIRLFSAMEIQKTTSIAETEDEIFPKLPFNTFEAGFQFTLDIPKFLIPLKAERFPKYFKPKTSFSSAFFFEQRPNYSRFVGNASFGYKWKPSIQTQHIINPLEINLIRIFPDSIFQKKIDALSPGLRSSYRDHLIAGMSYSYITTNKTSNRQRSVYYFRNTLETSGNFFRLGNMIFNSAEIGESYKILGITYAQFIKNDIDYRYFYNIDRKQQLAFRFGLGFGLPFGNSSFLPFEEAFALGGSNSIRAWHYRGLGPGAYNDEGNISFDKTGDLKIEASMEYRFPVFSYLEAAFFFDAGNVWFLNENEEFPGGEFLPKEFISQIAMGTGVGARLNFGFFLIRLDGGIRIKDPSLGKGERYVLPKTQLKDINWNIGIGYPF
jgi:outer membrane protein assembly factor BamA